MTYPKRLLIASALVIGGTYVALLLLVFLRQRTLLFPRPGVARAPEIAGGRLLTMRQRGRLAAAAYWIPPNGDAPTIVHFHGNGEQIADNTALALSEHG